MDDLMDMIISNESPMDVSGKIKELLFAKSAEKIDLIRPEIASSLFGSNESDE